MHLGLLQSWREKLEPVQEQTMEAMNLTLARWKQGQMLAFCKPTSCYSFDQLWLVVYPTAICMLVFCMFKFLNPD